MSSKQFATYKQQVETLIQQKHFIVNNKKYAIDMLKKIGYFNLVTGAKNLFKGQDGEYLEGVSFDDLVAVYNFDQELRALFLHYVLVFERHIKSALSYSFSEKFKDDEIAYLNPKNYDFRRETIDEINSLVLTLTRILRETDKRYIEHNRQKYQNVPLWILANSMSFGVTAKMYSLMKDSVKSKICSGINFLGSPQLLSTMLFILTEFRNVCAHNERLYCYKTDKEPLPILTMHKNLEVPIENGELAYGTNDLFAVTIIFKHVLDENDFDDFFSDLVKLLVGLRIPSGVIEAEAVFSSMGFPKNWKRTLTLSVNRSDILHGDSPSGVSRSAKSLSRDTAAQKKPDTDGKRPQMKKLPKVPK